MRNSKTLFQNIPSDNSPFWDTSFNDFDYSKIAHNFFDRKKDKISALTGVTKSSVRYDNKMPKEVKELLQFTASIFHLVYNHFNHDLKKTKLWFELPNPMLGVSMTPQNMIYIGRHKKLFQIVSSAIEGELP